MNRKVVVVVAALMTLCIEAGARVKDRGYDLNRPEAVVAPRGGWCFGGNAGFASSACNDYDFLVISGIDASTLSLNASPQFCWFFADNMGFGVKLSYARSILDVGSVAVKAGDVNVSVTDFYNINHSYSVSPFYRYYKPLGPSGKFSAFADIKLKLGGAQAKQMDAHTGFVEGTYSSRLSVALGADTGILVFFKPNFAMDVSLGLLSFNYSAVNQSTNQVTQGGINTYGANFMVDLLSLSFGFHCYLK